MATERAWNSLVGDLSESVISFQDVQDFVQNARADFLRWLEANYAERDHRNSKWREEEEDDDEPEGGPGIVFNRGEQVLLGWRSVLGWFSGPNSNTRKMGFVLAINLVFMVLELVVGYLNNSLGLISDAAHMLSDCFALFLGMVTSHMSEWPADEHHPYGFGRYEILSGFVNGMLLVVGAFRLGIEAVERLLDPPEIETNGLLLTSVGGLLVNIVGLAVFQGEEHGHHHGNGSHSHGRPRTNSAHVKEEDCRISASENDNLTGVYLHVLADTLGSIGVVLSSIIVNQLGWYRADPACSLLISGMIAISAYPLLRSTGRDLLMLVPEDLDEKFHQCLTQVKNLDHVVRVEYPQIWRHSSKRTMCSMHIIVDNGDDSAAEIEHETFLAAQEIVQSLHIAQCLIQVCSLNTLTLVEKAHLMTHEGDHEHAYHPLHDDHDHDDDDDHDEHDHLHSD